MNVKQIYTQCLSQASYFIESDGIAAIIDPIRDIDNYLDLCNEFGAEIKYVFITHFHADFISGHLDLVARTGATIVLGPLAEPKFPAIIAKDNEAFAIGRCSIQVIHTPGHTIESICLLLYNEKNEAHSLFTGDTLFIGDSGRPDLLSGNFEAEKLAGMLYDSIQTKLKPLPDELLIYPGHGAGSPCGKNLSKETFSSLGEQKKNNYAFLVNKEKFIKDITTDQPPVPAYFFKDAQLNKVGTELLESVLEKELIALSPEDFKNEMNSGAIILDTRSTMDFARQFITGSIHIGLDGQFAIWAGTLIDFDQTVILVSEEGAEKEAMIRLGRIGYDKVKGYLKGGLTSWVNTKGETDSIKIENVSEVLFSTQNDWTFLDVRRPSEVQKEHLPGSVSIALEELEQNLGLLNVDTPYAVFCAGGYRSIIAASILKRNGFKHVLNVSGGMSEIRKIVPELIGTIR